MVCAAPLGLNKCVPMINPGLAPWAMKSIALTGLLYVLPINILYYSDAVVQRIQKGTAPKIYLDTVPYN